MGISLYFDPQHIYSQLKKSTDVALKEVGAKIIKDTNKFVPLSKKSNKGSGSLRRSASVTKRPTKEAIMISYERKVTVKGAEVDITNDIYRGVFPFAGKNHAAGDPIKHWNTPNTGPFWLQESEAANLKSWIDFFDKRTKQIWAERKKRQR